MVLEVAIIDVTDAEGFEAAYRRGHPVWLGRDQSLLRPAAAGPALHRRETLTAPDLADRATAPSPGWIVLL